MAISAEITTDILMLMSTMTLRVAPEVTNNPMLQHTHTHVSVNYLDGVRKLAFYPGPIRWRPTRRSHPSVQV